MSLQNWLQIGHLTNHQATVAEVRSLLGIVDRELADSAVQPDWRVGVKHRIRRTSAEGVLEVGRDRIVFASNQPDDSRTWRISDIENISSSGPFELTIVTFERARLDYRERKQFNFRLKEALSEARYNDLWLKINKQNRRIQIP